MAVLLILSGLICRLGEPMKTREKRDAITDQPRMSSEDGNLVFCVSQLKNIEFKTSSYGKIKVNDDDLTELLSQIRKNKDEVAVLNASVIGSNQIVTNQIVQLNTKKVTRKACSSDPCQNAGTCLSLLDSFFCLCPNTWKGPTCAEDVNECQMFGGTALGCQNGALCENMAGSYRCTCTPEWYGPLCTLKYDDCRADSAEICMHGICIDMDRIQKDQPRYSCVCNEGWTTPNGSSSCTKDIDECSLPNPPCSQNPPVQCYNSPGSFTCGSCPAGWQGNGYSCQDIDECQTNNGGCSSAPLVKCMNTMGSYHCGPCPPGYEGDGRTCDQVNACSVNNGGCHPLASCAPSQEGKLPICVCPPGYAGNGSGEYGCLLISDICLKNNPCVNGVCKPGISSYICECYSGWTGTNCTESINECTNNPCQNGGICMVGSSGYTCNCREGWTGLHCETQTQVCGGNFSDVEGFISSPSWPAVYTGNKQCIYIVTMARNEKINLKFTDMDLENSTGCSRTVIEIKDGRTAAADLVGRYCSSTIPAPITSNSNSLWIKFQSDASATRAKFRAFYQIACGGSLSGTGVIHTPHYPNPYYRERSCKWIITQPEGEVVMFTFESLNVSSSSVCGNNYVEVRDGPSSESTLIGKYCGSVAPPVIFSTQRSLYVHFLTDASSTNHGFKATYKSVIEGCGGTMTTPEGTVISPGYPNVYPHGVRCMWLISVQPGNLIRLSFSAFNLEHSLSCAQDHLDIYDNATDTKGSPIGSYCGRSIPPTITSSDSRMVLSLVTDHSLTGAEGFSADYVSINASTVCGATYTEATGTFTSPNYPADYPANKECVFTISAGRNMQIRLNFTSFDLHSSMSGSECTMDYVEIRNGGYDTSPLLGRFCRERPPEIISHSSKLWVKFRSDSTGTSRGFEAQWESIATALSLSFFKVYNGNSTNSNLLAKLCGDAHPAPLRSTTNALYVKLRTDIARPFSGFLANYRQVCEGVLISYRSQGILESLNYPDPFPVDRHCNWTIQTTMGNTISYSFRTFQLEDYLCLHEYVKLYDGPNDQSRLIGTYCGDRMPPSDTTNGTTLYVVFVSDSYMARKRGFQLSWSVNVCNNNPLFQIYGGPELSSPRLAQLCTSRAPGNPLRVSSTGNAATVRFKTDTYGSGKGFKAAWREVPGGCGGVFQAPNGEIHSPNYPRPYDHNTDCSWLIKVDPGHRVFLNFTDFDTESASISGDSVSVYDGENSAAPKLAELSGSQIPSAITSTQNSMFVHLKSDSSINHRGFSARFSEEFLSLFSTVNHITISFTDFQTERGSQNCTADYVEILGGDNSGAPSLGRLCGTVIPPPVTSLGNALVLRFVSNNDVNMKGFHASYSASLSACGGTLHMEVGAFSSPGSPQPYPADTECVWTLLSSPGNRLTLSFKSFSLQMSENCSSDYVEIREGSETGPLLGRFCGDSLPNNVTSVAGHVLWVKFVSDGSLSGEGFQATFSHLFGNNIQGSYGQIASPLWPREYPHHSNYIWYVNVEPGRIIEVRFLEMDIEDHAHCGYDKLQIFDGSGTQFHLMGRYCGVAPPPTLFSFGSAVTIQFISDNSISQRGFLLEWTAVNVSPEPRPTIAPGACGGLLQTGETPLFLFSPGWPNTYASSIVCSWVIRSPASTVELNLLTVDIEEHETCGYDALVIRDGDNSAAPELATLCGREVPGPIRSSGDAMFLYFASDGSVSGRGFNASYHKMDLLEEAKLQMPICEQHYFLAPCQELIYHEASRASGGALQLHRGCSNSYLELRDGANSNSRLLAKLCGNTLPITYKSLGTAMYMRFRTDGSAAGAGFNANYSIATCGGTHFGQSGIIQSPGYPTQNYPDSSRCEWLFTGPTGHYLTIRFEFLDLQNSSDCLRDFVEIREYNASGKLLGMFCNNTAADELRTSDSFASVRFVSDESVNARGFRLHYEASAEACGGDINGVTETLSSPNYPNLYPHDRVCEWRITVPEGKRVMLTIKDLQLQDHQDCNNDYVAVYNGYRSQSPLLEKLCGTVAPGVTISSSGNTMRVLFITDGSVSSRGFRATFTSMEDAVCGGSLVDPAGGNFTSPGYDEATNYTKNLNCEWTIQNPITSDSTTYIEFKKLQLEPHQNCQNDFIEIRLDNAEGEVVSRLCGRTKPFIPLAFVVPKIWVHFVSNAEVEGLGFAADYMFTGCGGIQSGVSGVVESPNFPDKYPAFSHCAWLLEAPEGHIITLSFAYFHLEDHAVCRRDSLTLVNGASRGSPTIGQYCGTASPGTVQSGSNNLAIIFNSNNTSTGGGFYANWTSDSSGCGGYIHANSGSIKSPGWPLRFPNNSRCTWTIRTHESSHFELSFDGNFNIPDSDGQCERSFVKVWSVTGGTEDILLLTACGSTAPGPIICPGSTVKVTFQSQDNAGNGFFANFNSRCGANFTKPSGRIVSVNYPDKYENNLNCDYSIQADDSKFIVLTFLRFELEPSSSSCNKDGVRIISRTSTSRSSSAAFCGNTVPAPVSSRGTMSINFYTNPNVTMHGFMATYRMDSCGGTFNRTSGILRSPAHSFTNYHHNMNCTYVITAEENKIIELKFNAFDVELSGTCSGDYVSVYDGSNNYGKFCGKVLPPLIRSSSNILFLVFITDYFIDAGGWRATYRQTLGPEQGCGGYLTNATGRFGSPDSNGDGRYDKSLDCVWSIMAPLNKQINLTFSAFSLEAQSRRSCRYDFVKIFDGSSTSSTLQGTYCGSNRPPQVVSSSNALTVWFFSDASEEKEGFNATYITTDLLCGGVYNATSSVTTTTSPNYPNSYPPFTNCVWTIDSPEMENVKVKIQSFHLQTGLNCSSNYLEVKDSPVGDLGQLHTYCGTEPFEIPEFYSFGRTAVITFKSQEFMPGNGLSFTYEISNCNREYNQSFGYLKSPGWPGSFPSNLECDIILRAPENHSISLFFYSFNLAEIILTCFDYLEVRNGSTRAAQLLGTYCGNKLPNPIFPKNNILHLLFKSHSFFSGYGYEITWTSSTKGCGGTLFGANGTFTSPEYPASYGNNTACEWTIAAPRGRVLSISFAEFSIDDPGDCQNNYLRIYDGAAPTSAPMRTLCGSGEHIAAVNTTSNHAFIEFHADYAAIRSYFRIVWHS
ncbi:hypothetical protein GDO78_003221 [Eleutherodactylus coqui]|uniref:Cubilin n=1 Tax=Eleutherodactylus coqui TaxID=57060 RepID=A0A8J6EWW6_ELECQ|nr:hypothetical protein GDO78_003221 [Eleutherodactylus coqui]